MLQQELDETNVIRALCEAMDLYHLQMMKK